MKRNPIGMRLHVKSSRSNRRQGAPRGNMLFFVAVCGLLALIVLGKIYLERQTMQYGVEWEKKTNELSDLLKEADNLRMEREKYTNREYVLERAEGLDLRAPVPGQVRRLTPARTPDVLGLGPSVAANSQ